MPYNMALRLKGWVLAAATSILTPYDITVACKPVMKLQVMANATQGLKGAKAQRVKCKREGVVGKR